MLKNIVRFIGFGLTSNAGTIIPEPSDFIMFRDTTEGWPGSGFKHKTTHFKARRVTRTEPGKNVDELQLDMEVYTTFHSGHTRTSYASIALRDDHVAKLIAHIKDRKPNK